LQTTASGSPEGSSYLPESYPAVKGMRFNILTRDGESGPWSVMDLTSEGVTDRHVYKAVYDRNQYLENKYGFKINQIYDDITPYEAAVTQIKNINRAGVEVYHVVALNAMHTAGPLAVNNELIDLKTIPNLDLEKDFWNQSYIDNMTVGDKLFSIVGDLSATYYDAVCMQLFNKDLLTQKGIDKSVGNPYDFIKNGTWTLDVMNKMCALAKDDLNKDGKMTEEDMFGYVYSPFNNYALYYAGGNTVLSKDENDLPVLTVFTEKAVETVEKIKEMVSATDVNRCGSDESNLAIFNDGRALFINTTMYNVRNHHRFVRFNFGAAPTPKIDESQKEYKNVVSNNATVFAIPKSCSSLEEIGFLLNALAYKSQEMLVPAYFEKETSVIARDGETESIWKEIFKSAYFDLSFMYDVGWIAPLMNDMAALDLSSEYESLKKTSQEVIDQIIAGAKKAD